MPPGCRGAVENGVVDVDDADGNIEPVVLAEEAGWDAVPNIDVVG